MLLTTLAWAEGPWRHYNLDVSLTVPPGWKIIQGPSMLSLDPKQRMQGERRPRFGLTWRQAPPSLDDFQRQAAGSIKQGGGTLVGAHKLKIAGYPALKVRARMPEKVFSITTELILVRVDDYAGYLITTESMAQDTAAADPYFAKILNSLRLGPRIRKAKLPVKNE